VAHLIGVAGGWTYDLRLKTTAFSPAPYAVSFGLLPSIVTLALPNPAWAPWWASVAGAGLGLGIHGANALPDIEDDLALGAGGLPARLGPRTTRWLSAVVLLAATVVVLLGPGGSPGALTWVALVAAVVIAGAAVGKAWPTGARTPFALVIVLALLDVAVLVARAGDWSSVGTLRG
jgi:4-hydroxybenzoate polyprenyltransferase